MNRGQRHTDEIPWASFSDALTGMLFVFVITTFWFALRLAIETSRVTSTKLSLQREIEILKTAADEARNLVQRADGEPGALTVCLDRSSRLRAEPERESARVSLYMEADGAGVTVKWFEPCQATLDVRQQAAAEDIRSCITGVLARQAERYAVRVFLEGHTDALVVRDCGADLISNWELSGARAAAVTRAVLAGGEQAATREAIARAVDEQALQLLAVGLAETRPARAALCARPTALSALDRRICAALKADPLLAREAATLLAGADLDACAPPPQSTSCAGTGATAGLCRWANWCPDAAGDFEERRALLRRVDLRIELDAKVERLAEQAIP
ncbi:MAG: OmpA family protein [Candidatus Schekmanbacteria bacterium]|nr:OmpA family protein [Candidatus Schekmanbacteria bacterium]